MAKARFAANLKLLLVGAAVVLAGCDAPREPPAASPATTTAPGTTSGGAELRPPLTAHRDGTRSGRVDGVFVTVVRTGARDRDCPPAEVFDILQRLTGAIASDPALAASFAKADFDWYTASENGNGVVPRRHAVAEDPAGFRAYLEERRRQHERLRLVALRIGGDGNFQLRLIRMADDLASSQGGPHTVAEGKGKVNCEQRSVIALSHAMFPEEPNYRRWRGLFGDASAAEFRAAAMRAFAALRREA